LYILSGIDNLTWSVAPVLPILRIARIDMRS
jgi:hypothetical protein